MGKHMATNLISANHHVTIFDTNLKAFDHFKEHSTVYYKYSNKIYLNVVEQVQIALKPENAVMQSDFVILMLPNGKIVRDVCQLNIFS
jgi:3-hydroxyisobutyrate dehydrogenase-like beta-hydroxyacid dehydrogenase